MKRMLLLTTLVFLLLCCSAVARTWYITPGETGDAPTIHAGIDSAAVADTVLLADGTFTGDGNRDIDFGGKALTVVSESGDPQMCTISCGGSETEPHRGFLFISGETDASILEGVTVQGGYITSEEGGFLNRSGGAIICYGSLSPTIRGCAFVGNTAQYGGAIVCSEASPEITDCTFDGNEGFEWYGGAIACLSGAPTISGCTFTENSATTEWPGWPTLGGAIAAVEPCTPVITGCMFVANSAVGGGAIWYYPSTVLEVTDCVFSQNMAETGGAISCRPDTPPISFGTGMTENPTIISGCTFSGNVGSEGGALYLTEDREIHMTDCTLYGNVGEQGSGIYIDTFVAILERTIISFGEGGGAIYVAGGGLNSEVTLGCCDVYGNDGGDWVGFIADQMGANGNFSSNPLFCHTAGGNFTVETCSPCLPGNHPQGYDCGGTVGAFGSGCPCGTPVEPTTWSTIKSQYR